MERLITVGTDGSPGGRRALDWAIRHAQATGARLEIVTAYQPDALSYGPNGSDGMDLAREFVAERQQLDLRDVLAHLPGVRPMMTHRLVAGEPVDVLIEAAKNSDLLVLGSHGRGQLAATLLGSVSEACVRRGVTPVLIVPAHDHSALTAAAGSAVVTAPSA